MRGEGIEAALLAARAIDNSQVVREVDPRHSRELWLVLLTVLVLAAALGGYAWPHFAARQASQASEGLQRERERLVEENRKLRLEKASLEDLRRVERLALERLGLQAPAAERVVVVEPPATARPGARLADQGASLAPR